MKLLLSATALTLLLTVSAPAFADSDWHGKSDHAPMEAALSKLPAADAAKFRDAMKQSHDQDKALYDQTRTIHEELKKLLAADTFDKDAYLAKSKELSQVYDTMHANMASAFANAASQLTPDERKTLAANLQFHRSNGMHGDKANGSTPAGAK